MKETQYPQDELGRYIGKTPHEYPDHLNYLKASPRVRYNAGYGSIRKKKRIERTRPRLRLRLLMSAIDKARLVDRVWYNVEVFCPDWTGNTDKWGEFGVPIWIDALIEWKTEYGRRRLAAIMTERRPDRNKMIQALQEKLDKKEIPLLIMPNNLDILTMSFQIGNWIWRMR